MRAVFLCFALAMAAATTALSAPGESGRVRDIVSPNAIRITLRGRIETVQLVGLDISDYDVIGKDVEKLRDKAIEYAASLALGQTVQLEKDARLPERNEEGQLQRYARLDSGVTLNAEMVTAGWARVAEKPFFSRMEDFQKLQNEARTSGRGMWRTGALPSTPGTTTGAPLKAATPPTKPPSALPPLTGPGGRPRATPRPAASAPDIPAPPTALPMATAPPVATTTPRPRPPRPLKPPSPPPPPEGGNVDRGEIMAFLERWQTRWKARILEDYLSLYTRRFQGDGLNIGGWRKRKMRAFASSGEIQLTLSDLHIGGTSDRAEVRFTQAYRSVWLSDVGTKHMVLVRESDGWKVLRENWWRK